jgi:CRP/FNR family transcriptional regulator, cyclic AMP receptor protein
VFERNPGAAIKLIRVLSRRLRLADERLADIALKQVPARVASLILQLVEEEGVVTEEGYKIPTLYTQERLGSMIGAKRVAVTRAFTKLQHEGNIELKRRLIYIKDIEALKRIAEA